MGDATPALPFACTVAEAEPHECGASPLSRSIPAILPALQPKRRPDRILSACLWRLPIPLEVWPRIASRRQPPVERLGRTDGYRAWL